MAEAGRAQAAGLGLQRGHASGRGGGGPRAGRHAADEAGRETAAQSLSTVRIDVVVRLILLIWSHYFPW